MELSPDFIAIQGILSNVIKTTGEFTKINYRGGKEEKILQIMSELQKYLSSKCYIKNEQINHVFDKQLEDIVLFLAINTSFNHKVELEEYTHLLNIIPPLSKCVFANVVYGLNLCKYYCTVIEKLPLKISTELLNEMIPCLNKASPQIQLEYSQMFIMAAAKKLETVDYSSKTKDEIDNITTVTNIILMDLTDNYTDQPENMNSMKIYQHMGHCLVCLFDILLYCNKNCSRLEKFVGNIITACCSIIKNITINVYCAWAELEVDDEVFQTVISEKAYRIVEGYQKNPEASELVSMLSTIARKPLSFSELVERSDTAMIIKKVNKCDSDQKNWFRALLTTYQIFEKKNVMDCVNKWSQLCNNEDVTLLLNLCVQTKNEAAKKLVVKCASSLTLKQLNLVLTRHFYRNKFDYVFDDIEPNLMLIFNKLENSQSKPDVTLELGLLMLQNAPMFYKYVYRECLKNTYYTDCLHDVFLNIKEISEIDGIGVRSFNSVLSEEKFNQQKVNNVSYLLKKFLEIGYLENNVVLNKILCPLVKEFYSGGQLEDLNFALQIVLESNVTISVLNENCLFLKTCLEIMKENRCKFLNFVSLNQEIVNNVVEIFLNKCEIIRTLPIEVFETITDDDIFTNYYKHYLSANTTGSFFKTVCPEFDIGNKGNCISQLLQILPSAIPTEWINVYDEIQKQHCIEKCIELITNMMILLSQLVGTQDVDKNKFVYAALKYCIGCFGLIIQKIQKDSEVETEMIVATQISRLIAKLPVSIKEAEGLAFVNVLTQRSLKALGNDKDFLCRLLLIKNAAICKVFAEKIKEQ